MSGVRAGVVATAHYLPPDVMTSAEIAEASGLPLWVVEEKLGIKPGSAVGLVGAPVAFEMLKAFYEEL